MERKIYEPIGPPRKTEITSLEKNLDKSPDDSFTRSNDISKIEASADPLQMLLQKQLSDLPGKPHNNQPVTIYRVPASSREIRKAIYEPRVVSIGPYYHGREELRSMEEHKLWYLRDFMSRKPEIGLDIYLQAMRELEPLVRQCYSESVKISADKFVPMLLLDGCFILEYFPKYKDQEINILCDIGWGGPTIFSDLLLLENQIPFFIIHKLASFLYDLNNGQICKDSCTLVDYLYPLLPHKEKLMAPEESCKTIKHLLHLYYICLIPKPKNRRPPVEKSSLSRYSIKIPCAYELHDTSVKFKGSLSHRYFDIKFNKGVIEMPVLVIDNFIRTIFTNIVAFEQSHSKFKTFTSYVLFLSMLVDSGRDVSVLEDGGVLELVQLNKEQAADFFNELAECWSMDYDDDQYKEFFQELQKYCSKSWNKSRAKLMQDYFNNPWSSISVVAAVILLILTVLQTYYTVFPDGAE